MRYSRKGSDEDIDEEGQLTEDGKRFCMEYLLRNCTDFKNELNDLEHLAKDLSIGRAANNVGVMFTPKFHCELAGEGVEYSWGASKRIYRKLPLSKKRSYSNFEHQVKKALSCVNVGMCRKFSGKARGYMVAYMHKKLVLEEASDEKREEVVSMMSSYAMNEKIHKIYRSHRDANTFDAGFIERTIKECIIFDD